MKKILFIAALVAGVVLNVSATISGGVLDVHGVTTDMHVKYKKAEVKIKAGETRILPLSKILTPVYIPEIKTPLYLYSENNGFLVTGMIPAQWDGKANVDVTVTLNKEYQLEERVLHLYSLSLFFDKDGTRYAKDILSIDPNPLFKFQEVSDRALIAFAKKSTILKNPGNNAVATNALTIKLSKPLAKPTRIRVDTYGIYSTVWLDTAEYIIPENTKKFDIKYHCRGDDRVCETETGFTLCMEDFESDSAHAMCSGEFAEIIVKPAQKVTVTTRIGTPTATAVTSTTSAEFEVFYQTNITNIGEYNLQFNVKFGGTAKYDEDYTITTLTPSAFTWPNGIEIRDWGTSGSVKLRVDYAPSVVATGDKTIIIKLVSADVGGLNAKASGTLKLDLKVPVQPVTVLCRYDGKRVRVPFTGLEETYMDNWVGINVYGYSADYAEFSYDVRKGWAPFGFSAGKSERYGNYTVWLDTAKTDSAAGMLFFYGGQPVCKGVTFDVGLDSVGAYFEKAPKIHAAYYDPIKDPTQQGKQKLVLAKPVTKLNKNVTATRYEVELTAAPLLYNKKALKTARNQGQFFADVATAVQKQGAGMDLLVTWKQGKICEENASLFAYAQEWIATVIAVPPEFAATEPLTVGGTATDSVVIADTEVVVTGKFFTAKPKAFLEYKVDGKIKTLNLKTLVASMDSDGNSTLTVAMPNQAKIDALGDSDIYLVIDSGSALAARKVGKK